MISVQQSKGLEEGTQTIAILGRAQKDPTPLISSGEWKFDVRIGTETYTANMSVLSAEPASGKPVDIVISGLVPRYFNGLQLDISQNSPESNSEMGGVGGESAIRTIPLPVPVITPNRT